MLAVSALVAPERAGVVTVLLGETGELTAEPKVGRTVSLVKFTVAVSGAPPPVGVIDALNVSAPSAFPLKSMPDIDHVPAAPQVAEVIAAPVMVMVAPEELVGQFPVIA